MPITLWTKLRLDRIRSIMNQVRFIDNSLVNSWESEESIIRHIHELKEMVDELHKMDKKVCT